MERRRTHAQYVFATATGLVVLAAHSWLLRVKSSNHLDWVFASALLLDLVPAAVFGIVVRRKATAYLAGSLLVVVTGCSWLVVPLSTNDFALMSPMLGWFAALGISALAGVNDHPG